MYSNCCRRRATTSNPPGRTIWGEYVDASQSLLTIREWPLSNLKGGAVICVWPFILQTNDLDRSVQKPCPEGIVSDGQKSGIIGRISSPVCGQSGNKHVQWWRYVTPQFTIHPIQLQSCMRRLAGLQSSRPNKSICDFGPLITPLRTPSWIIANHSTLAIL
jgi:hypothetical protein